MLVKWTKIKSAGFWPKARHGHKAQLLLTPTNLPNSSLTPTQTEPESPFKTNASAGIFDQTKRSQSGSKSEMVVFWGGNEGIMDEALSFRMGKMFFSFFSFYFFFF